MGKEDKSMQEVTLCETAGTLGRGAKLGSVWNKTFQAGRGQGDGGRRCPARACLVPRRSKALPALA